MAIEVQLLKEMKVVFRKKVVATGQGRTSTNHILPGLSEWLNKTAND